MPEWLLALSAATAISLAGNYVSHVISTRMQMVMLTELGRRLQKVEDEKIDGDLHDSEIRRLDGRIDATDRVLISTGHRIGAVEQKFIAIETSK